MSWSIETGHEIKCPDCGHWYWESDGGCGFCAEREERGLPPAMEPDGEDDEQKETE